MRMRWRSIGRLRTGRLRRQIEIEGAQRLQQADSSRLSATLNGSFNQLKRAGQLDQNHHE